LKELDAVKIVKLLKANRPFDGTEGVKRPPHFGDIGAIVHFGKEVCTVECVDSEGYTVWLADFLIEELEETYG
jgi:hypothetical protein